MELFIFIVFLLFLEVLSYKFPHVKVSPDVIRESSSVKISCEIPADPSVNQCYFYTNREEKNIKNSWKCELDLTGAEVFRWAAVKSPESLNIYCYYTIHESNTSSSESPATVMVRVSTSTTKEQTTTTAMKTLDLQTKTNSMAKETMGASALPDSTRETKTSVPHSEGCSFTHNTKLLF